MGTCSYNSRRCTSDWSSLLAQEEESGPVTWSRGTTRWSARVCNCCEQDIAAQHVANKSLHFPPHRSRLHERFSNWYKNIDVYCIWGVVLVNYIQTFGHHFCRMQQDPKLCIEFLHRMWRCLAITNSPIVPSSIMMTLVSPPPVALTPPVYGKRVLRAQGSITLHCQFEFESKISWSLGSQVHW